MGRRGRVWRGKIEAARQEAVRGGGQGDGGGGVGEGVGGTEWERGVECVEIVKLTGTIVNKRVDDKDEFRVRGQKG